MKAGWVILAVLGLGISSAWAADEDREFNFDGGAGFLGVTIRDVNKDDVGPLRLGDERGVVVRRVEPDGPAEKAGLKEKDVILKFHGESVTSATQFARLVRETPPGRNVPLEISRDGAPQTLKATVGTGGPRVLGEWVGPHPPEMPRLPPLKGIMDHPLMRFFGSDEKPAWLNTSPRKLGIRFEEISGQLAKYFRLTEDQGLLVTSVDEEGPAAKAGLKAGDVLLKIGGDPIRTGEELYQTVEHLEAGQTANATAMRDGRTIDLKIVVGGERERRLPGPTI
jgi:serine protease Do